VIIRVLAVLCAAGALAGCSSGHGAASSDHGGGSSSGSQQTGLTPHCPPNFNQTGHFLISTKVAITDKGFTPVVLITGMGLKVVWTNTTTSTQSVYFDQWGGSHPYSGPIAPGHSWTWKASRAGTALYHSTFHPTLCGQVTVQLIGNQ
jgi:hypothetical protein